MENEKPISNKNRKTAGTLALLAGFGIHNFYLGKYVKGAIHLLLYAAAFIVLGVGLPNVGKTDWGLPVFFLITIFLPAAVIWSITEGMMLLAGDIKTDGKGKLLRQAVKKDNNRLAIASIVLCAVPALFALLWGMLALIPSIDFERGFITLLCLMVILGYAATIGFVTGAFSFTLLRRGRLVKTAFGFSVTITPVALAAILYLFIYTLLSGLYIGG